MALVGTRDINNIEVEIHADKHGGWSILEPGDGTLTERRLGYDDKSLDNAVNKARLEIKKRDVKIAVPFKTMNGKSGIAHGRHARSDRKILTKIAGKSESLDHYTSVLKHDTPKDVIEHLDELAAEQRKLKREYDDLYKQWKLDLSNAVDKAIKEAAEAQS